jgi:hypothetical protein
MHSILDRAPFAQRIGRYLLRANAAKMMAATKPMQLPTNMLIQAGNKM